jgi:hypothetical protein
MAQSIEELLRGNVENLKTEIEEKTKQLAEAESNLKKYTDNKTIIDYINSLNKPKRGRAAGTTNKSNKPKAAKA